MLRKIVCPKCGFDEQDKFEAVVTGWKEPVLKGWRCPKCKTVIKL